MASESTLWARYAVITVCAIDAADKALLPATFKALDQQLGLGPAKLSSLMFAQNFSFASALVVWSSLMQYYSAKSLMVIGCYMWAGSALLISVASTYEQHMCLRFCLGAALASCSPLGQAMLCDLTSENQRGFVFGQLHCVSGIFALVVASVTTVVAAENFWGVQGWRIIHMFMTIVAVIAGMAFNWLVPSNEAKPRGNSGWAQEQLRMFAKIVRKRSFLVVVMQGVVGAIPWNAMSFLTYYFQLSGYSDSQAARILMLGGLGGILGALVGGSLGDHLSSDKRFGKPGRVVVAQASVILGTFAFVWMMSIPYSEHSIAHVIVAFFVFNACACWTAVGAIRPICSELFLNSYERAQIISWWMMLEGLVSSSVGAPAVAVLSEKFGYKLSSPGSVALSPSDRAHNAEALRVSILGISVTCWVACALNWIPMYWTYSSDCREAKEEEALVNDMKGARLSTTSVS
eukprot:TRINITY_DN6490_c0_g1_i1.p1 TRINITY_DN6490_c0_g1~~TRINITY_DN6490_c0_g1_i1.p1  ORF type:complete len:482 (+),score=52.34 TRINITY_DN6490_c0_g1_i1:65-1447(+)